MRSSILYLLRQPRDVSTIDGADLGRDSFPCFPLLLRFGIYQLAIRMPR